MSARRSSIPGSRLLDAWSGVLDARSDSAALLGRDGSVISTFSQIAATAESFGKVVASCPALSLVAFTADNEPAWIPGFLALLEAGASVLLLEAQAAASPLFGALLRDIGVTAVASLSAGRLELSATGMPAPDWESAPAILKATSGTSGLPRGIRFTAGQILADCDSVCETMGIDGDDLNYGAISMAHSYGFSNLVTPLICRGVPLVVTNDRLPRSILSGILATRATVFPATPIFFQKFNELGLESRAGNLRLAISAGAPLPVEVARRFWQATGHKIHAFYGSSECGGICYDADGSTEFLPGYVGTPMKDVQLELDPDSGSPAIRSPAVGEGYHPQEVSETLQGGVFRPADLLAAEGSGYRVVGRVSDLINVAGRKLNPAEVEAILLGAPGVLQAIVFGIPNESRGEMPAACVVAPGATEIELLAYCRQKLPAWQAPKFVQILDEIPATSRGKISRADLARRFATR